MITKDKLDQLLVKYEAQPVGNGYIDVIVKQENIHQFVHEFFISGVGISCITWWEYVRPGHSSMHYGHGGPQSKYHGGWFSELCSWEDAISPGMNVLEILAVIENKQIVFSNGEMICFRKDEFLTPALWLDVLEK